MVRTDRGPVVAAVGAFMLAASLTLATTGAPLLVVPLDERVREVSTGRALVVFDPAGLTVRAGVEARLTTNAVGQPTDPEAGPDRAVYRVGSVLDDRPGGLLAVSSGTVCVTRSTRVTVGCDDAAAAPPGPPVGQRILAFPFDTERRDYGAADASEPRLTYAGDAALDGLDLYEFRQTVRDVVVRRLEVPGRLAGATTDAPVVAELVFGSERVFWVEPVSGVVVMRSERPSQTLRAPDGRVGPPLLFGKYRFDEQTVTANVERAHRARWWILLVRSLLPWTLGVGGAALLVGGAALTWRIGRRGEPHLTS